MQGLGRVQCDAGGVPGCYRGGMAGGSQPTLHLDDSRSVRSDDGEPRPASGCRSDLNDSSHCGLGDDSDAGARSDQLDQLSNFITNTHTHTHTRTHTHVRLTALFPGLPG